MKNIKTKSYILWLFTLITLGVTYAYTSVSSSLTYLRWAWDIGHIGYIITEIFDTNAKIKSTYLPEGLVVGNASVTQTGIVKLINATGSISEEEAPTINILTQVWNNLNTRINTLVSSSITSETDPTVNILAKATLSCSNNQLAKWNGSTWVCSSDNDTIYTHPANHSPSIITQDANNRFVTDTEKSTWNNKQNALWYTPLNKAGDTLTWLLKTRDTLGVIGVNTQWTPGFEILSPNSSATDAAYMTFHRPNLYAVRFWLDTDNKLKVWWWSMWNVSYEICHAWNLVNLTNSTSTTQAPTANALKLVNDNANTKASLVSPNFTGTPTAPTPNTSDVSTNIATTAYVYAKINAMAAGWGVSFAGYTALTYTGNLWYKKWADQKCAANFPWSRVMMYDDYVHLWTNYPYTYDIWMIDGGDLVSMDGASGYEYHIPKDWNGMNNTWYWRGNTCKWWSQWVTSYAYNLNTAWIMSFVICGSTYRLACVY